MRRKSTCEGKYVKVIFGLFVAGGDQTIGPQSNVKDVLGETDVVHSTTF